MKYLFPTLILLASQASAHTALVPHVHEASISAVFFGLGVSFFVALAFVLRRSFLR